MKNKIKNIEDLRNELLDVYSKMQKGEIGIREGKENANVCGKIMTSAKIQMEYNLYMKCSKVIPFLDV